MRIGQHNYIKQLKLHNEKALMYVIDTYGGLLMSVIRKHMFALPQQQEECFDDVLLKIWEHISDFDESRNSFQNWAAAIAKYRAIDYLRQYRREPVAVDIEDTVIAHEDQMLTEVIEREISNEIEKMLSCLKPADRELFLRLYVEEQDMEQVSREMGMKKEVIYNHLSRGRQKIRKEYKIGRGA
ncbi:MAG: sigma-70 family RNA polymerase sigma factor [Eubacterium sp.]|nr:sigma-70 family RNA polymerase sigma factor [Eubacterium sp.]